MDKKKYIRRVAETLLLEGVKEFPACLITGPRQAGKSTLIRETLQGYAYATLDNLDVRALAKDDPKRFFVKFPPPVIIDEIQYAPDLLSYIKMMIDEDRSLMGRFVLTGSQTFQVMKGVSESLAGRIDIFDLYPLTWKELLDAGCVKDAGYETLLETLYMGFYPEPYVYPKSHVSRWFRTYIKTYIERDVRDIKAIPELSRFQTFIRLLAARAGQLLNISEIGKEAGIATSTAKDWLSILESTYIIRLLRPYHSNATKRLVKSPKLYFYDTGLLCFMLGIESKEQLESSPFCPSIFENMFIIEAIKRLEYKLSSRTCYFYRSAYEHEIDLIIASDKIEQAFEVKFTMNPNQRMTQTLNNFKKSHPDTQVTLVTLASDSPGLPNSQAEVMHWLDALNQI